MEWLVEKVEKIIEKNTSQGKPSTILEIGIEMGGTLNIWRSLLNQNCIGKENILIGIDTSPNIQFDISKSEITTELIIGDSHDIDTLRKVKKILFDKRLSIPNEDIMRQLDFVYIDGEHTPDAAKKDFYMYGGLVRNGGAVGFHDYFDVKKFLDLLDQNRLEIFKSPPHERYGVNSPIGTAIYHI